MKVIYPFNKNKLIEKNKYKIWLHWLYWSFSHKAAEEFFPQIFPEWNYLYEELVDAETVFHEVIKWNTDIWICAFANSWSGWYVETLIAMSKYNFTMLSTIVMPLNMCLVTKKNTDKIQDVKKLYGHPVAIRQCEENINKYFPNLQVQSCTDKMDTALSAKMLSEWKLDNTTWVFCSGKVVDIYPNLKVLIDSMHHDPRNATFFIIFTK